jgi:glutamate N-acetyltransferase/amino-acid N-acetyltransferase
MSVTAPSGFVASGVACGIKESGAPDLSLVATADGRPVAAAGVFTSNKMTAAPVIVTNRHLVRTGGRTVAVILNSGNANAAMGDRGVADAGAMCAATAAELGCDPHEVLVCHRTGIPLPIDVTAGPAVGRPTAGGGTPRPSAPPTRTARNIAADCLSSGMAKGAMLPNWRRCSRCSPPTPCMS